LEVGPLGNMRRNHGALGLQHAVVSSSEAKGISMPLSFYEPTKWAMVVMDGNKAVAKARHYGGVGWWLLKLESASWTDPRARQPIRDDLPQDFRDLFSKYPNMLAVRSRNEARKIMQGLANATAYRHVRSPEASPGLRR